MTIVDMQVANEACERATFCGVPIYELDTREESSKTALFHAMRNTLPLNPPLLGTSINWDGFADSLWEGIYELDASSVVIIWRDATSFKAHNVRAYQLMVSTLDHVAELLADPVATVGTPKVVRVFVQLDDIS